MATNHPVPIQSVVHASRNSRGQFLTGHNGGPGRPLGSRNRLAEQFIADLQKDWEQHGSKVIETVRRTDPAAYLRVVATLVRPVQHVEVDKNPFREMSREELRTVILQDFPAVFPDLQIVPRRNLANQPKLAAIPPPRPTAP